MPVALILIAIVLIVTAVEGTQGQLVQNLEGDFTGSGNFIYWLIAIIIVGSIGYFGRFRTMANTFLALIILGMFLSNKGFFKNFTTALGIAQKPAASQSATSQAGVP